VGMGQWACSRTHASFPAGWGPCSLFMVYKRHSMQLMLRLMEGLCWMHVSRI
jgi:hypothetical protein